jgi:hypothetical protein
MDRRDNKDLPALRQTMRTPFMVPFGGSILTAVEGLRVD